VIINSKQQVADFVGHHTAEHAASIDADTLCRRTDPIGEDCREPPAVGFPDDVGDAICVGMKRGVEGWRVDDANDNFGSFQSFITRICPSGELTAQPERHVDTSVAKDGVRSVASGREFICWDAGCVVEADGQRGYRLGSRVVADHHQGCRDHQHARNGHSHREATKAYH
jgi:hypothetical protein